MKKTILQWNVLLTEDIRKIEHFIKKVDPDICCLQELTMDSPKYNDGVDTANFLAQSLNMYSFFVPAQTYKDIGSLGNAILSKVEPSFTRSVYVKEPSATDVSPQNEGRVYVEALIEYENSSITVATTHLAFVPRFEEKEWKQDERDKLLNEIQDQEEYILAGDLNALPNSKLIQELSKELKNAGPEMSELTFTTKPFEMQHFKVKGLEYRLDYVFTSPDITVNSCKILQTDASDHLPLLLEIEV